ncbi:hypothetical protein [Kitasatospora sp. NPDC085879]|uniref:hypothetical protein n=1 Tax=Kitasatospora sp. NPDC085879 TaxID=3154769 RepID=UPI0034193351
MDIRPFRPRRNDVEGQDHRPAGGDDGSLLPPEAHDRPATFSLFVREFPPSRSFLVADGIESALEYLAGLGVDEDDVRAAVGTMAHSPVEASGDEVAAFRAFAKAHPAPVIFLVDTFHTPTGVATAARVLQELGLHEGCAVRLDSGDLLELSVAARRIVDAAGLPDVRTPPAN